MFDVIIRWILMALALLFVAWLVPGVSVDGFLSAFLAAIVIGAVNIFIKPILMILTAPINILTLGLFTFVINALMFLLVSHIVPGFETDGFLSALLGSIVLSFVSIFINKVDM
jgi:putative membrane protein